MEYSKFNGTSATEDGTELMLLVCTDRNGIGVKKADTFLSNLSENSNWNRYDDKYITHTWYMGGEPEVNILVKGGFKTTFDNFSDKYVCFSIDKAMTQECADNDYKLDDMMAISYGSVIYTYTDFIKSYGASGLTFMVVKSCRLYNR